MAFYDPIDYLMQNGAGNSPSKSVPSSDPVAAAINQNRFPANGSYFGAANNPTTSPRTTTGGRFQFGPGSFQRYADDRSDLNDMLGQDPATQFLGKQKPTPTPTPVPAPRLTPDGYRDRYGWMT